MYKSLDEFFRNHMVILWANLSRFNNLLIILNISMFFLSGFVARGYYYTFFSIGCFVIVGILLILPLPLLGRLWCYLINLLLESIGLYFLISSVVFWVRSGGQFVN